MTNATIASRTSDLAPRTLFERDLSNVGILCESGRPGLVREIAPTANARRCPSCDSIVYSRRHRLCGVCSLPLPEEFLFSIPEARRIEQLLEVERQRHRKWLSDSFRQ